MISKKSCLSEGTPFRLFLSLDIHRKDSQKCVCVCVAEGLRQGHIKFFIQLIIIINIDNFCLNFQDEAPLLF